MQSRVVCAAEYTHLLMNVTALKATRQLLNGSCVDTSQTNIVRVFKVSFLQRCSI